MMPPQLNTKLTCSQQMPLITTVDNSSTESESNINDSSTESDSDQGNSPLESDPDDYPYVQNQLGLEERELWRFTGIPEDPEPTGES